MVLILLIMTKAVSLVWARAVDKSEQSDVVVGRDRARVKKKSRQRAWLLSHSPGPILAGRAWK